MESQNKVRPKIEVVVKESKAQWVLVGLIGLALIIALVCGVAMKATGEGKALVGADKDGYQALFLTNGQVYFGKLSQVDSKTVQMKEIYYLQVQQPVQPKADTAEGEEAPQPKLAKLGGELHGPKDEMYIDRSQILFWENLKDKKGSKVVDAIERYKESKQ